LSSPKAKSFQSLISGASRLVPVLHVEKADHAEPLLQALEEAGIVAIEVTLRSAVALQVIEKMRRIARKAIVGAGTVTTPDQFKQVVDAGARFAVSPALTPSLAEAAHAAGLPYLPGVCTPSEALRARELGFTELKFFPADLMGGVGWLKHVYPLYPDLRFCPTGGISDKNVRDYLRLPNCMAAGGAWLAPKDLVDAGRWSDIKERAAISVRVAQEPQNPGA
jgi:2-dehydro-3-deoxyphosphogluconate aldolase / (4S)-4-hydroxy-2-oxoglutarate aldolase